MPPVNQKHKWAATLDRYCWDDPDVKPSILSDLRSFMWIGRNRKDSTVDTTVQIFRSAGHAARAQLVLSLLSLPLPDQRDLIDSSDYDAILLPLQGLVEQAVAAVRSVTRAVSFGAVPKWWMQGRRRFDRVFQRAEHI
ncbi:hypothetical protein B0H10DRAFT_2196920 [Mycena sp. CBHHK59/15]|nr:hypothetical protein B0H10DRAFT_2196920 [Mycena sp. CBHHK59/15]